MKSITRHIGKLLLFAGLLLSAAGCYDLEGEREICDYNLLLRYDYNEENSATENMIKYYVYTIDEYIFDEDGILFLHNRFTPDICREMMNSEVMLPPGRYSVIAVGNEDDRSATTDRATGSAPVKGVTHRDDMRLTLDDIASHYALMPEYIYPRNTFDVKTFDADTDNDYPSEDEGVIHHIPFTHFEGRNVLSYRNDTDINADSEMWGEFISYRFKMAHSPKLSIVRSSDGQLIVPAVIDLWKYLDWYYGDEPDYTRKQEYYISIEIDGDQILMMPLNVADWEEGRELR